MASVRRLSADVCPVTGARGWGFVSLATGHPRAVGCDVISPKASLPIDERLLRIFEALRDVIARSHRLRLAQRDFEDLTPEALDTMRRPASRTA